MAVPRSPTASTHVPWSGWGCRSWWRSPREEYQALWTPRRSPAAPIETWTWTCSARRGVCPGGRIQSQFGVLPKSWLQYVSICTQHIKCGAYNYSEPTTRIMASRVYIHESVQSVILLCDNQHRNYCVTYYNGKFVIYRMSASTILCKNTKLILFCCRMEGAAVHSVPLLFNAYWQH